ncbi:MAG TPA: hypothetical protein VK922_16970 [Gemmatimonadaceae bacterium]|nr:hypothetical protein [Gemmatimonadaceae bacterium]
MKIWTTYRVQWQCVHRKTGKTSPKYPPATNLFGANVDAQVGAAPSGGQLSGSDIFISPPTQSALLHLCVNNSGAFTDVRIVSAPIPWAWSIAAWNDADPAGYYAELLQNIP